MKYCPLCGKEYSEGDVCERDGAVLIRAMPGNELTVGQVLGGSYRIVEKIGQGGMATVYRGVQIPLERDVAIKVMLPVLGSTPSMIQRFFQEAKLLCQMNHPNVVRIIDFGNTEAGLVYMVMEYLHGATLRRTVPQGGLPTRRVLHLMRQICDGVGAAHRKGLIHRDIKPDNIYVSHPPGEPETVKILDFGIARAIEDGDQHTRLTQTGLVMGTPGYLAPEQIGGAAEADTRSDIYALGAILYLLLTGVGPYQGKTPHSILAQQLREPPLPDLGQLRGQERLAQIVRKAMRLAPDDRYQTPAELFSDLVAAVESMPPGGDLAASSRSTDPGVGPDATWDADHDPTLATDVATELLGAGAAPPRGSAHRAAGSPAGSATDQDPGVDRQPSASGSTKRPLRAVGALAGIALLAFVLWSALGSGGPGNHGGDDDPSAGDGLSAGSVAGAEGLPAGRGVDRERVLVGMSAAFSGSAKELGRGMRLGIETCFAEANADGGVHGRRLELVALDDGYEPSRAVANMANLLLEREAFAILGNVGTPTAEVAVPLVLEQKAPFVGAFTGADVLRRSPPDRYVFHYRASYAEETAALVEYFLDVRGLAPNEIAVFAQEDGFGDAGYRGVTSTLEARGHDERVPRLGYRRNRIEVEPAVETLLREHPETRAVILVATYRAAAELIRELEERETDLLFASLSFVGSQALAEELGEMGPDYAEGVIVSQVVPHFEADLPGVERYRDALAEHSPAEQPGFVSLEGYLACRAFVEGAERAGPGLTAESFVEAMESMPALDLGIGSELRFGPDRHQGSSRVWGTVLDASARYQVLELKP